MHNLVKEGVPAEDAWQLVREGEGELPAGDLILPLARFVSGERAPHGRTAAWFAPDDDPLAAAADVLALPLLAVDFPAFTDGRGYSVGRLLRERRAFAGELRAIGDVQRDQLHFLHQVGFDSFAIRADLSAADAAGGLADFSAGCQTSWRRRQGRGLHV